MPTATRSDKPVVAIGAILPLTGGMAHVAKNAKKAITYAVDKFNENPGNAFNYKLVIEDDNLKTFNTAMAFEKLIAFDKISAVLSIFSRAGGTIQPIAIREKIIHFSTMSSSMADGKYTFNNFLTTYDYVLATYEFIDKRDFENIAIMVHNNESGQELTDVIKPAFKDREIRYKEYRFDIGEREFGPLVAELKKADHDLVLLGGFMLELESIYKEMQQQNVNPTILGYDIFENCNCDRSFFDKCFEVGVPVNQEWATSLGLNSYYRADYMYDTINIIMQTCERAGKNLHRAPTADEFREALYEVREFEGITGKSTLRRTGKFISKAHLKRIVNGKVVMVEE